MLSKNPPKKQIRYQNAVRRQHQLLCWPQDPRGHHLMHQNTSECEVNVQKRALWTNFPCRVDSEFAETDTARGFKQLKEPPWRSTKVLPLSFKKDRQGQNKNNQTFVCQSWNSRGQTTGNPLSTGQGRGRASDLSFFKQRRLSDIKIPRGRPSSDIKRAFIFSLLLCKYISEYKISFFYVSLFVDFKAYI